MAELSSKELKQRVQQLKETGEFGGFIDADEIGQVLDFYNQQVDDKKERSFANEIEGMNKYYWKLAKWSVLHPGEEYKSTGTVLVESSCYNKDDDKGGEK